MRRKGTTGSCLLVMICGRPRRNFPGREHTCVHSPDASLPLPHFRGHQKRMRCCCSHLLSRSPTNANVFILFLHVWTCLSVTSFLASSWFTFERLSTHPGCANGDQ